MRGFPRYRSGEVVPIGPLRQALPNATTETLIRSDDLEIARIILRAGEQHAAYQSAGHVVLQCVEGCVTVNLDTVNLDTGNLDTGNLDTGNLDSGSLDSGARELRSGELVHLRPKTRHALHATVDSAVLFVGMNPMRREEPASHEAFDILDEALEESFPASDPPAISTRHITPQASPSAGS